jgi:glucose-1-phosphate cytidylyltransferase
MQVVILCGGKGTRLGDVTGNTLPKPMVQVGERPILWHIMRHYARFGHRRFILCAGHLSWAIKDYFLTFHARHADLSVHTAQPEKVHFHDGQSVDDWEVTIVETGAETMTAGRIRRILPWLDGDDFMLTYGDGVSNVDLAALEAFHAAHGRLATMTGVIPPGRFGELRLEGDKIVEMQEKPESSDRYINAGFMIMKRAFVDQYIPIDADDLMLERDPLAKAALDGDLHLYRHQGFWQCMDTARDWALLNDFWAEGNQPWTV